MTAVWLAFITGLTTGGLSCLAVQGGLLASALVQEVEEKVSQSRLVSTLIVFLTSKLVAYTVLGFLLGWLGTMVQITPYMRAALQIAIGLFMLGMALRLLTGHPWFRYFIIEPPKAVTRFIRRFAKQSNGSLISAGFLGLLTVLIPCGITQAVMVTALATGSPVLGAAIMFAFVLGTSPVFFALAYLATKLGENLQSKFRLFAGIFVLIFALIALEGGLNLAGSPVSYAKFKESLLAQKLTFDDTPTRLSAGPTPEGSRVVSIMATSLEGYQPAKTYAKAGEPFTFEITSKNLRSCASAFVIPKLKIQKNLPMNGKTKIEIPAQEPGVLSYSCTMGMYRGSIIIE